LDYYFDVFLQTVKKLGTIEYIKEIERYNSSGSVDGNVSDDPFFTPVLQKYPEFETLYHKYLEKRLNKTKMVWEYYVKSRKLEDYRQMIENLLYHPPHVEIVEKTGLTAACT
jgi:hypothetical protein